MYVVKPFCERRMPTSRQCINQILENDRPLQYMKKDRGNPWSKQGKEGYRGFNVMKIASRKLGSGTTKLVTRTPSTRVISQCWRFNFRDPDPPCRFLLGCDPQVGYLVAELGPHHSLVEAHLGLFGWWYYLIDHAG